MTTSPLIDALLSILENPWSEKGYKAAKIQYEKLGMDHEAAAFEYLIEEKFRANDSTVGQEQ